MNAVKTNLIQAVNSLDVNRIRTLLQQGINNLSDQDKEDIVEAFYNYRNKYSCIFGNSSINCTDNAFMGGLMMFFSAGAFITVYALNKLPVTKILDQKEAKEFKVFISYIAHYVTLITKKSTNVLKYVFGGMTTGWGLYVVYNFIGGLCLADTAKKQQINRIFRHYGFPQP